MTPILSRFIRKCAEIGADPETVHAMLAEDERANIAYAAELERFDKHIVEALGGNVYCVPVISPSEAAYLREKAAMYSYAQNEQEGADYRIEEAMLEVVDPMLYKDLTEWLLPMLNDYALFLFSTPITSVESFQIAKYRPEGTPGTGWHHDKVSDFTCVISLNPGEFKGGGTGIRMTPACWHAVDPLPIGWGMIFNGRCIQHRGMPVTKGERLLLVCWCSTK